MISQTARDGARTPTGTTALEVRVAGSRMRSAARAFSSSPLRTAFPQLLRVMLPGTLKSWEAAGFARTADSDDLALNVGGVEVGVGCLGAPTWGWRDGPSSRGGGAEAGSSAYPPASRPELAALADEGWAELDVGGIATSIDDVAPEACEELAQQRAADARPHPNGAAGIYSLVVTTPDLHATVDAFGAAGLELRRLRAPADPASELSKGMGMAFFKFGVVEPAGSAEARGASVILEVVAPAGGRKPAAGGGFPSFGDAPAIAGLVVTVPSLPAVAELLGPDRLGAPRPAVQGRGRQIASVRSGAAGMEGLPALAFITPPSD